MYTTPETFVDIDYLLNHIGLKLLQLFQDSVHFHHLLLCLLTFCFRCQINSWFQAFVILAYIYYYVFLYCHLFIILICIIPVDVNMNGRISRRCFSIMCSILLDSVLDNVLDITLSN